MTSHLWARSRRRLILLAIACCLGGIAAVPQSAGAVGGLLTTLQDENAFDSAPIGGMPYSGDPVTNMQLAKNQGATGIRVFAHWQYSVPFNGTSDATNDQKRCGEPPTGAVGDHPENYYDFSGVVEQLDNAKNANPRPISTTVTLDGPIPCWASLDHSDAGGPGTQHGCTLGSYSCTWRPDPAIYSKWTLALARALGSRVDRWSPWNEPNLTEHLDGPGKTSLIYRNLWFTAYGQIHPIDPSAPFYFSETAYRDAPNTPDNYIREQFCESAYSSGDSAYPSCSANPAVVHADQLSFHNYVKASEYPIDNKALLAQLDDVLTELQNANRAGDIQFTAEDEAGVHVCTPSDVLPDDCEPGQFTEDKQADYLNCMQESAWKQSRLKLFGQYELQDPPDGHGGNFLTGLRRKGSWNPATGTHAHAAGAARPALDAFAQPIAAHRLSNGKLDAWGGWLRPPIPATLQFVGYTGSRSNPTILYTHTMIVGAQGYFQEDLTDAPQGLKWLTIGPGGLKSREANGGECQAPAP